MVGPFDSQTIRDVEDNARVRRELADAGFEPPLYTVCVGANGAMLYSQDAAPLAVHWPDGEDIGFRLPQAWMIVDRMGKAALYTRARLESRWRRLT